MPFTRGAIPATLTFDKRALSSITRTFAYRLCLNFLYAVVAYLFVLQVIFPKYIAPLPAFHSDMYIAPDFAAQGVPFTKLLFWPRPVLWFIIRLSGQLGYEGSVIFTTVVTLLALALALTLLERFVLRRVTPWWLTLGTFMLAMAGTNFYFVVGYDIATSSALLFGLTGIYVAEARKPTPVTFLLTLLFFVLSSLSKESFVPAMIVYGTARLIRGPRGGANAVFFALPFLAAAAALLDARLAHSTFVVLSSSDANPYRVSLAPDSVFVSAKFYLAALENPAFILLLLCCAAGVWINGRTRAAFGILTAALALYSPYLVLPNHRLFYYQWAAMPLLMLLVPLAWMPKTGAAGESEPEAGTPRVRLVARAAIVASLIYAIAGLGAAEFSPFGNWSLAEQDYNRSVLAGIRSLKPTLGAADSVLVVGITNVFHPWHDAEFLSRELGFKGVWYVAAGPGTLPIDPQPHAQPIAYDQIHWGDYDWVVVFADDGRLAGSYHGYEVADMAKRRGAAVRSNLALVAALQLPAAQAATSSVPAAPVTKPDVTLPRGLSFAGSPAAGAGLSDGVYGSAIANDPSCCWIAPDAVLPVMVSAGTRELDLQVYLPSYGPFVQHGQTSTVSAPETGTSTHTIPLGASEIIVRLLRPSPKDGLVRLRVRSSAVLVPAASGINGDSRRLALIVLSVQDRR